MSSIVIAPSGGAEHPERARGSGGAIRSGRVEPADRARRSGPVADRGAAERERVAASSGVVAEPSRRVRGWHAVRPRSLAVVARVGRRVATRATDAGMATAEYAIATLAAVGFAGVLLAVLKSDAVRGLLTGLVKQALKA